MRDSMKITVSYQFWHFLLIHLGAAGVTLVFQTVAFWYFMDKPLWKEILSVIFAIVYFGFLFMCAKKYAIQDKRPYTPLKPSMLRGILLGVFISLCTLAVFVLYKAVWAFLAVDGIVTNVFGIAVNFIFMYWTFPYYGMMNADAGNITWYSAVLMLAVPVLASTSGYAMGLRNFRIGDSLEKLVYEQQDK